MSDYFRKCCLNMQAEGLCLLKQKEEEKKEPEESELEKLIIDWGVSVHPNERERFKQLIIALAIKKIDECRHVPAQGIILFDEANQRLEGM